MPVETVEIDLSDPVDRWRYVCPRGHRNWEPTNHHFWCSQCAKNWSDEVDPEFHALVDERDRREIPRDQVRLVEDDREEAAVT